MCNVAGVQDCLENYMVESLPPRIYFDEARKKGQIFALEGY
jgi:hypothetical protein